MRAIIVNLTEYPLNFADGTVVEPANVGFYAEGEYAPGDYLDIDKGGIFKAGVTPLMYMRGGYRNLPDPAKNTYYVVGNRQAEVLRGCGVSRKDIFVTVNNGNFERGIIGLTEAL